MKFLKNRVLPVVLAVSILSSLCVVPAYAAGSMPSNYRDEWSVDDWTARLMDPGTAVIDALVRALTFNGVSVSAITEEVFWSLVNTVVNRRVGPVTRQELEDICKEYNNMFNRPMAETFGGQLVQGTLDVLSNSLSVSFLGGYVHFVVEEHMDGDTGSGLYRIKDEHTGLYVVSSSGAYPYYDPTDPECASKNQWILDKDLHLMNKFLLSYEDLSNLALDEGGSLLRIGNYYLIYNKARSHVLANASGIPYAALYDEDRFAINQDRNDSTVIEDGVLVEGDLTDNSTSIDLSNMLVMLPDGSINFIDEIVYDESTKTYHVDSHDVYNYTTYNYYTWNYYINYTSITYIGQTEEYNKYYEVYYELPDGRDSADLTVEELEQLNVEIDVIPYIRGTEDTSVRALYHFDGDTRDSSFWNYQGEFEWEAGASLTYMDSGVFNGALYLDENSHRFRITLPSRIGNQDFTLQFRYYQSHTPTPVTDSYIAIGGNNLLRLDGASFKKDDNSVLSVIPVGTWNEVCIMRENGILHYYLNGVYLGFDTNASVMSRYITFVFGSDQQTFKYFDELRFVNKALFTGSGYECSAVPFDTNLSLVLPDSMVPVADEWWSVVYSHVDHLVSSYTCSNMTIPDSFVAGDLLSNNAFPVFGYTTDCLFVDSNYSTLRGPLSSCLISSGWQGSSFGYAHHLPLGTYTLALLLNDGNVYTTTFDTSNFKDSFPEGTTVLASFDWGSVVMYSEAVKESLYGKLGFRNYFLRVVPNSSIDLVAMELVSGSVSELSGELVQTVQGIDRDSIKTPTLAVKTDIPITSYQIGGVRPSLPTKGLVWALVEAGYMRSLQVYTGTAWEGVDGRIWTGERWIPYSSYNVITLQDMYDIVDATQDYEYIYSESGFWSWWQKSWNAFTEKLFSVLGVSSGDGTSPGVDLDAEDPVMDPTTEDDASLWQFVLLVVAGGKAVVRGVRHLFSGVVSTIPDTVDDLTGAFEPGGIAVGALDGTSLDPDAADLFSVDESEVLDPWRYR